jgi:dolichol kinase
LPATFVDPTFAGLALSLILAIFLILDLLRASQLPPLSKPIASFLAPYVDGRDFRGPVVISHIFLLIGCAIPLWLALASLPRTGSGYLSGWELPGREVSMVSGVICVGLGDAAASLIGRRYGRRKWIWGGGKSLEGSLAFAIAVFAGIAAAWAWLKVGGWPVAGEQYGVATSARNAAVCASMASLTEAVLTGGNDNVIVPVVLWTCVKSLAI